MAHDGANGILDDEERRGNSPDGGGKGTKRGRFKSLDDSGSGLGHVTGYLLEPGLTRFQSDNKNYLLHDPIGASLYFVGTS